MLFVPRQTVTYAGSNFSPCSQGDSRRSCEPSGQIADLAFSRLVAEIGACTICAPHLPLGPRPIVHGRPSARLLIISQDLRSTPTL
jgi:hypothetical protein